jgi:hypothetical protein
MKPLFPYVIERDQAVCPEAPWETSTPKAARPQHPRHRRRPSIPPAAHSKNVICRLPSMYHCSGVYATYNMQHFTMGVGPYSSRTNKRELQLSACYVVRQSKAYTFGTFATLLLLLPLTSFSIELHSEVVTSP